MLPKILSLTMNIPDNELIIQWNNTHNQTLLKILLIIAKAKLNPSILFRKQNSLVRSVPLLEYKTAANAITTKLYLPTK